MRLQLNNYQIKMLAAIFMLVDHVGVIFFPQVLLWRIVGRFSFPLFAWLLTQGERYTRSFKNYLLKLVILGLLSQPLYLLTFSSTRPNILFTLSIGLITLRLSRHYREFRYLIWGLGIFTAELLRMEYGAYGIIAIYLLSVFQPKRVWWLAAWVGLHLLSLATVGGFSLFQLPAVIAPLWLYFANHQQGASARWFYSFYPLHLLALFLVRHYLAVKI